ncbi:MAG: hypothetical protein PHI27_13785 [Eubacteriales bacterium]|nr:hypothetical protein [Eubacteriales bacterium]
MGLKSTIQNAVNSGLSALGTLRKSITYSHPQPEISVSDTVTFTTNGTITGTKDFEAMGVAKDVVIAVSGATKPENNQTWIVSSVDGIEITVNTTYRAPAVETATVTIRSVNYHPDSGTNGRLLAGYTVNAIILEYSTGEMLANPEIANGDRKVIFSSNDLAIVPSISGQLSIDSIEYEIKRVSTDPANATYEIQARRAN